MQRLLAGELRREKLREKSMENDPPVVWCWGNDSNLANHVRRVYPMRFAGGFVCVCLFVGVAAFAALSKLPPFAVSQPPALIVGAALKIVAWMASAGHLWPEAGPRLLGALAPAGSGLAVAAKAILAAACGGFAGWKVARNAMRPRDGYRHIRGTRLYKGGEAVKVLADQLRLKK